MTIAGDASALFKRISCQELGGCQHRTVAGPRKIVRVAADEALGFVLAAALYAVGPTRLDEVVGHCITALADHNAFGRSHALSTGDAIDDLCDAARRIVDAWERHDRTLKGS